MLHVWVALGDGNGTYHAPVEYHAGFSATPVVTGDCNNDGKIDLAVSNPADANVCVLLGNGDGTFQPAAFFGTG